MNDAFIYCVMLYTQSAGFFDTGAKSILKKKSDSRILFYCTKKIFKLNNILKV